MNTRPFLALCALALSAAPGACGPSDDAPGPTVIVLCVEGLRHDYLELAATPTLLRLASEGGAARSLLPVFPSNSVPSRAALATGVLPGKNGIVNNRFYDRRLERKFSGDHDERDALLAEPLWVCAVRQGVPAAAINWSSAAAPFQGVSASRRSRLDEKATDEERVDELLDWLWDKDEEAPRLVLIYLDDLDDLAHKQGPEAPATLLAVERIDGLVRTIVDAIEDSRGKEHTTLFVLGDHGMSPAEKCVYLDPLLEQRGIVAESYVAGAVANVYLAPGSDAKAAQAALAADSPLFKAYLPAELPAAYGYVQPDRVGDLVLIGARGVYFHAGGRQPVGPPRTMGVHGLPSEDPDMRAALVAWGRGVSPGRRWEEVRIVDLYPSVCRLLGITPSAQIDGVVIPGIEAAQPTAPQP